VIETLGAWVLSEACAQLRRWRSARDDLASLRMSVNLSPLQLRQPGLAADFARVLEGSGVEPGCVTLEVTESGVVEALGALHELRRLGVRLAIDDFGTGYSSLSSLRRLPVDALKIDKSFVDALGPEPEDLALVEAIVRLGRRLGLETVAEGVESEGQVELLREVGCELAQGFYWGRPVPAADLFCA